MSSTINTKLDANQVLKQAYDEANKRLRVDAAISATLGDVKIVDGDGDELQVNPDGSINTNVSISASGGDNISISDGTDTLAINADGSVNVAGINDLLTELQQKTEPSDAQNIRALSSGTDSVSVPGVATAANQATQTTELQTANTTLTSIDTSLNNIETDINSIDSKLPNLGPAVAANSIPVTIATDNLPLPVSATLNEPIKISGAIDGASGTEYGFVYNLRQQILATHDRTQTITYADFGTKDERITQIDYASATFPGYTARKTLSYTLVGTKYRRDTINWTIV